MMYRLDIEGISGKERQNRLPLQKTLTVDKRETVYITTVKIRLLINRT